MSGLVADDLSGLCATMEVVDETDRPVTVVQSSSGGTLMLTLQWKEAVQGR